MKESCNHLGTAANTDCVSPENASEMGRMVGTIALKIFSNTMGSAWAFAIAADVSTDDFGSSHFDVHITFPPLKEESSPPLSSFHLLAISSFNDFWSGKTLFTTFTKFMNATSPSGNGKLICSSTDGAPNMTSILRALQRGSQTLLVVQPSSRFGV